MTKAKAAKASSQGPIVTEEDSLSKSNYERLKSVKLPKIESDVAEAVCVEVLRGLYCDHLSFYFKNRDVKTAESGKVFTKEELESHEKVLSHLEGAILYMDQTDKWLNDLHEGKLELAESSSKDK
jgi:hypothetical protein